MLWRCTSIALLVGTSLIKAMAVIQWDTGRSDGADVVFDFLSKRQVVSLALIAEASILLVILAKGFKHTEVAIGWLAMVFAAYRIGFHVLPKPANYSCPCLGAGQNVLLGVSEYIQNTVVLTILVFWAVGACAFLAREKIGHVTQRIGN